MTRSLGRRCERPRRSVEARALGAMVPASETESVARCARRAGGGRWSRCEGLDTLPGTFPAAVVRRRDLIRRAQSSASLRTGPSARRPLWAERGGRQAYAPRPDLFSLKPHARNSGDGIVSYSKRAEIMCRRLVLEQLYDACCFVLSSRDPESEVVQPSPDLRFKNFAAFLQGHARYIKSMLE